MRAARIPATPGSKARIWDGTIPGTHEPGFVEPPIVELEVPEAIRRLVHGPEAGKIELHCFRMGECTIMLGHEPCWYSTDELRWHLTISCIDHHPSWDEIKTARYRLLGPDTVMAMILPPTSMYVNVAAQDHVMQLWEIRDEAEPWAVK